MILKILVVDDEPDIVRMLHLKLQRSGFEVFSAYNGAEAVAKTIQFQPDAVLMDVMMPDMNGFAAMIQIKQSMSPAPLVLMLTALDTFEDMQYALHHGADDYIVKPFSPRDLMSRLNVALIKAGKTPPLNDLLSNVRHVNLVRAEKLAIQETIGKLTD